MGLCQAIGRYSEAEPLLMEASKIQQRSLGHDHPHTVASLSNLATVYEVRAQLAPAVGESRRGHGRRQAQCEQSSDLDSSTSFVGRRRGSTCRPRR